MSKKNERIIWILLVLILLIILFVEMTNDKKINCPECKTDKTLTVDKDKFEFLNEIKSDNLLCTSSSLIELYRCNNVIEEKFNSYGDLVYIKTIEEETTYSYLYDSENRPIILNFNDFTIKFTYDDYSNINSIIYFQNTQIYKIVKYDYNNNTIVGKYSLPTKISIYNQNEELLYYITFEVITDHGTLYIKENTYNSAKKNTLIRYYYYWDINTTALSFTFRLLNYIPEIYYSNNPFYNIAYQHANHGNNFDNTSITFVSQIDKIIKNGKEIKYYYEADYTYDSEFNFIIFNTLQTNGLKEPSLVIYKADNSYFKYEILRKSYRGNNYYEITKSIELTKDEFDDYKNAIISN